MKIRYRGIEWVQRRSLADEADASYLLEPDAREHLPQYCAFESESYGPHNARNT